MAASPQLLADRYRVLRRLGAGGVATVFLAEDEKLGRQVAVKRLHAHSPGDAARRFEREARLGASLNHPSLVSVYDITTDPDGVIVVMEYVEGETLADALRRGPVPREEGLRVLRSVAAALDHAHSLGVVHCDVKPANVLLGADGRVKVVDLGIALAADTSEITGEGSILGTPSYMAPEQLEGGRSFGPSADVYSLAAVAFEMLSGRRARRGRSLLEMAHHVATEPPPDVREAWPQAPPALAEMLRSAMARDPGARPASAGELVEGVEASLAATPAAGPEPVTTEEHAPQPAPPPPPAPQPPAPTRQPPAPPARRSGSSWPRRLAAAAAFLVVAGALVAVLASGGDGGSTAAPPEEAGSGGDGRPTAPAPEGTSPDETVTSFYETSAAGNAEKAFEQGQSTLESIEFEQVETTSESEDSAEVAISTVATHTDGVDQCEGTLSLVSGERTDWLIDAASITCPQSTRPQ
ncbi:MAG: serine/threonine-protein kinase [Thermoleophilaceae bacterium]